MQALEGVLAGGEREVVVFLLQPGDARGEGPQDAFIALGYAGWEPGQLEQEILDNAWLTLPMNESVLFSLPYEDRWLAAWRLLGVDVATVSSQAGHA